MSEFLDNRYFRWIFFGNYFYGICLIALAIESSLQQGIRMNQPSFYLLLFFGTISYYNLAFSKTDLHSTPDNERLRWHQKHQKVLSFTQIGFVLIALLLFVVQVLPVIQPLRNQSVSTLLMLLLIPLLAWFYYGINSEKSHKTRNLRKIGWLKPFIIGFVWAGLAGLVPQMYQCFSQGENYQLTQIALLLFMKNFMFISVLSIMFDIKDYAKDYNFEIKTFVVKFGLRNTIFFILLPLLLLGWLSFVMYGYTRDFSLMKIFLNTLPFLLCMLVALELQKRKSIYFYLVVIDGLMLVKALCGSLAMVYF